MKRHRHTFSFGILLVVLLAAAGEARELADAAQNGNAVEVRALLAGGADVNAAQPDGATALHWAVYREDEAMVAALLAAGADVSVVNVAGKAPVALAAETGNARILQSLLDAGADPDGTLRNGETPLMMAARTGITDALVALLRAGADVNAREPLRGTTPLMWAVSYSNTDAVRLLVEHGADVSAQSGPAPLGRSTRIGLRARDRISNHLLNPDPDRFGGADMSWLQELVDLAEDFDDERAALALEERLGLHVSAARTLAEEMGRRLRGEGPGGVFDSVARSGDTDTAGGGLTPLVFAARIGDLASARVLLEAGADVNQVTRYGYSPLLAAIQNGYYQLADYLLDQGADPNLVNNDGWNPLYFAVRLRNIEGGDYPTRKADMDQIYMIRRLLDAGADPNARMLYSTETRTVFTNPWLHEEGATPFLRASYSGDIEVMHLLLEYGADPMIPTFDGVTPLMVAAGIGWVDGVSFEHSPEQTVAAVKLLIDLGHDVNAQDGTDLRTALMGAAHKGHTDVIRVLLDHGADPAIRDIGSRDTMYRMAGVTWQAIDYADGLVRVGVQSAVRHPQAVAILREAMLERGLPVPPEGRTLDSVCFASAELC